MSPQSDEIAYALAMVYRESGEAEKASLQLAKLQAGDRTAPGWSDPLMDEVQALRRDHHWHLTEGLRLEGEAHLEEAREQYDLALRVEAPLRASGRGFCQRTLPSFRPTVTMTNPCLDQLRGPPHHRPE